MKDGFCFARRTSSVNLQMQPQTNPSPVPAPRAAAHRIAWAPPFPTLRCSRRPSPVLTPLQGQRRGQLPLAVAFALQCGLLGLQQLSSFGKPLAFYGPHVSQVAAHTTLWRSSAPTRCSCRASMPLASRVPEVAPAHLSGELS